MPTSQLMKIHREQNIPMQELEKMWAQAKAIAASEGNPENWGLIETIFKGKVKKYKSIKESKTKTYIVESLDKTLDEIQKHAEAIQKLNQKLKKEMGAYRQIKDDAQSIIWTVEFIRDSQ